MTTTTHEHGTSREVRRRALEARGRRQAFWTAIAMVWQLAAWFWGLFLLVQVVLAALWLQFMSVDARFGPSSQPPLIFLFAMGIVTAASFLTLHVAAGTTRRSALTGWLLAAPVLGVTFAVANLLVTAATRWISARRGLELGEWASPWLGAASDAVVGTIMFCGGIAICLLYRRLGGWWGTLALLGVSAAVSGIGALLSRFASADWLASDAGRPGDPWTWLLCAAVAVAVVAATWLLGRRLPID